MKLKNPLIDSPCAVHKRRSTDFEADQMWNGRSGYFDECFFFAYLIIDALVCGVLGGVGPAGVDGEPVLPHDQLVDVDDQPDEALKDHGREQVHVDSRHFVLAKFPGKKIMSF